MKRGHSRGDATWQKRFQKSVNGVEIQREIEGGHYADDEEKQKGRKRGDEAPDKPRYLCGESARKAFYRFGQKAVKIAVKCFEAFDLGKIPKDRKRTAEVLKPFGKGREVSADPIAFGGQTLQKSPRFGKQAVHCENQKKADQKKDEQEKRHGAKLL